MSATHSFRRRSDEYSTTTMLMLARTPPIQRPVKNRVAANSPTEVATAESAMPTARPMRHNRTAGRRPNRSPAGPITSAPRPMPARPALSTTPSAEGLSIHSLASTVAVKATTRTSKPSRPAISTHTAMMPTWNADIVPARSARRGSMMAAVFTSPSCVALPRRSIANVLSVPAEAPGALHTREQPPGGAGHGRLHHHFPVPFVAAAAQAQFAASFRLPIPLYSAYCGYGQSGRVRSSAPLPII